MGEMQETGKWYEDVPYQECKSIIKERLASMSRDFIAVGYYLKYIRDKKLYKEDGYASVWEFAEDNYGIKTSTASRWMSMNDKFSQGGNTPLLDDRYQDFGKSQLQEMLYLTDDQMEQAKPNMPAKEIRAIRKPEKKSFEECAAYKCNGCCDNCHYKDRDDCPYDRVRAEEKLSAYGTEKMVRPENSITDAEGCKGGHYCFSCSMDCQIRQEDRYCMEATLAKPFGCTTINMLECLRQDVGDKCQFINHELAYHRSGDNEPDPCCKECKEPCGYACPRAARKVTKSVAPAQEEPESIDTLEFSVRVRNVLKMAGIDTIKQLLDTPDNELVKIRNLSKRCLDEIHSKLDAYRSDIESPQEEPEPAADCPPGISSCIRQEWGTDPDQQHEGSKECAKCWKDWKKTQKALQGLQKEVEPEQVSGEVMEFEEDEPAQEWPKLLSDMPLFNHVVIQDYLQGEEHELKEYLECEGLPEMLVLKKQMKVAGLRLLLDLTRGGDRSE